MAEKYLRVRPAALPISVYLNNPHRGLCTFQHFNGDKLFPGITWSEEGPVEFPPASEPVVKGYMPTTVSYCRWFWSLLEPQQGKYDFTVIDKSLQVCKERRQTLAVRLMSYGSKFQPQVPQWYAKMAPMNKASSAGQDYAQPVLDAPEYLEHWGNLVKEFARRYDGNPLLESIDVTFIGPWGEGDGVCSIETVRRFQQLWKDAFPKTPRLSLFAGEQMQVGIEMGTGWRADCFGDLAAVGSDAVTKDVSWNHMYDAYPGHLFLSGASRTWQAAPVHFEACGVPMYWFQHGYDIDFIVEQGLKYHTTYFMPKYTYLPEEWMDKLNVFCNRLGYRYIFRQALMEAKVQNGGQMDFQCWMENVGVAPIYRRYDFALRFRQDDFSAVVPLKNVDIRTWLPGDFAIHQPINIPAGLRPGLVEISAGLIDPATQEAKIDFAVAERFSDRWVQLGKIELV